MPLVFLRTSGGVVGGVGSKFEVFLRVIFLDGFWIAVQTKPSFEIRGKNIILQSLTKFLESRSLSESEESSS